MQMKKLMIVAAIVMMGSFALTPWARADDSDDDGLPNSGDKTCKTSDINPTIINPRANAKGINCDSGAPNLTGVDGCTAMDLVNQCNTDTTGQNKNKFNQCVLSQLSVQNNTCEESGWLKGAFLSAADIKAIKKCFK